MLFKSLAVPSSLQKRNFIYIRFTNVRKMYEFYSLLIYLNLLLSILLPVKFGEACTCWVLSPFVYFHKIKLDFHKNISWHWDRPVEGFSVLFPSKCNVQTVFRHHPYYFPSTGCRWISRSDCPGLWNCVCWGIEEQITGYVPILQVKLSVEFCAQGEFTGPEKGYLWPLPIVKSI